MHDLYAAFLHEQLDAALAEASADGHQFAANTSANGKAAKAARRRAAEAAQALLKLAARAADAGAQQPVPRTAPPHRASGLNHRFLCTGFILFTSGSASDRLLWKVHLSSGLYAQ